MKTKKNEMTNLFMVFLLFFCTVLSYSQTLEVRPLNDFYGTFNDRHRIILNAIEARNDLTITQKLLLYESEITKLKEEFRADRRQEYESKSVQLSVSHSCTKGSSGGVKDCGWKCINAPNENAYTRTDWISVVGDHKGTSVNADGTSACLKMTRAGKGRNAGTLYATFKYKPGSISILVDTETIELFNRITKG